MRVLYSYRELTGKLAGVLPRELGKLSNLESLFVFWFRLVDLCFVAYPLVQVNLRLEYCWCNS